MPKRGAKPKPAALRVVNNTHRPDRHGSAAEVLEDAKKSREAFGALERPSYITGEARKCWDKMIAPADWLDGSRLGVAVQLCEMWKEFRRDPSHFQASKHAQMRACMAELGLTDERNRTKPEDDGDDPSRNYF